MLKPVFSWTEKDLEDHKKFDDLISRIAKWEGNTADMVQLYRSLVWFAGLREKIQNSQAKIEKVYNPAEEQEKAKSRARPKAEDK